MDGERRVFLFNPRPHPWPKSADHDMAHINTLFCMPMPVREETLMHSVVIIGDSTLDLPGVMYGLACVLRKSGFNLLWMVSKAGAGAKEQGKAWHNALPATGA